MSSVYTLEPATRGKVVVKTSLGALDVELFSKEAPKACRNFVQLCLEGYYEKTVFHRVIKDFMFRRRALVACANEADRPNSNGSQFFITLGRCDWLTKKNTIFGSVTGDTVYNLMKFNELEVDGDDRPEDPPHVVGTEVVWNPFDDIVPRHVEAAASEAEAPRVRDDRGRVRNKNLLSFGADEEYEDEDEGGPAFALKKDLRSPQVVAGAPASEVRGNAGEPRPPARASGGLGGLGGSGIRPREAKKADLSSATLEQNMVSRLNSLRRELKDDAAAADVATTAGAVPERSTGGLGGKPEPAKTKKKLSLRKALGMKLSRQQDQHEDSSEARRRSLKRKSMASGNREKATLARLSKFTAGLRKAEAAATAEEEEEEGRERMLPAAWRVDDYLDGSGDDGDDDLRSHVLFFKVADLAEAGKASMVRRDNVDDYTVLDPLLEKGKGKGGGKDRRHKRRHHTHHRGSDGRRHHRSSGRHEGGGR
ncbi:cyclophilin-type peptidyl-prolyl cis-trans isomerase [Chloropicon primus]|uniref:Cyclophilin-type peptidyl-prolyl cis-trans isomerase n=1 Tax=Chloropicon primus TaxID=1764295 RepID=A0A5B8MCB9_9CHLO|nr:cyclophilin-type peptidyl-prolyl cis-trans isomerase [Chloropicon primus]UPQ96900.1 cyclophilin-type peptidyl-prolyl cis-trans isomerase [Chloropicon primus]|eukprot:QDZ17684.1 cyclophilin-type peptidyl-prolyl cis-trans isomerase [Chloropicon primus]